MASAWVSCRSCLLLVEFGKEQWKNNKPYCKKCYGETEHIHKEVIKKRKKK